MKKVLNVLYWLLILILIGVAVFVYKTKYFNDYIKIMKNPGSSFSRVTDIPEELLYEGEDALSYKIESDEYNNALFYKTLKTKKNTPYKVSCYVKTENVEFIINDDYLSHGLDYIGGANISIYGENERSKILYGNNEWQKLEFEFNSRDREEVDIAFRLGTDMADSKGSAIFSNIVVEEGKLTESNIWNFAVVVFDNIDLSIEGKNIKETFNEDDLNLLKQDIDNFEYSLEKMSKGKIIPECNIVHVNETLTDISKDEINGYYIDVYDVYNQIDDVINSYEYDHLFFVFKSEDLNSEKINSESEIDWVGLGGMHYNNIGYSNIRLPVTNNNGRHMFKYDRLKNTFPEEVFIHEFLHNLERVSRDYELDYIPIHNYSDYGYASETASKLKRWYTDFLNKEIIYNKLGDKGGIDDSVYDLANPVDNSNFINTTIIEFDNEPENFIEGITLLIKTIKFNFTNIIESLSN